MHDHILNTLRHLHDEENNGHLHVPHPAGVVFGSAWETRTDSKDYSWDGLKRGGDSAYPSLIFQYTLAGWGYFRQEKKIYTMTPQTAFITIIPSDHQYYLPVKSQEWTFFWFIIRHPYVVSRMIKQAEESGPVLTFGLDSLLLKRSVELLEQLYTSSMYDSFAEEEALFRFLVEYERTFFRLKHPPSERERLLQSARACVLRILPQPITVEQLAEHHQMSRSAFSHAFKTLTGQSPAYYITQIRLEEATNSLINTQQSLEVIAHQTGFANATHFCKVFRRFFHLSPGEFRRQMGCTNKSDI